MGRRHLRQWHGNLKLLAGELLQQQRLEQPHQVLRLLHEDGAGTDLYNVPWWHRSFVQLPESGRSGVLGEGCWSWTCRQQQGPSWQGLWPSHSLMEPEGILSALR